MPISGHTVEQIRKAIADADASDLREMQTAYAHDTRKGVIAALEAAQRRIEAVEQAQQKCDLLYENESQLSQGGVCIGLDEVGRGPLAGPLTVAGVVLPRTSRIVGLDDSKKLTSAQRETLSKQIRETAVALSIQHASAQEIDQNGIMWCLRKCFRDAVREVEEQGVSLDTVLLDGNPLGVDPREVNVIKGDATCASIAAASIVAKVARDQIMVDFSREHPAYGFERNKGYGSREHEQAISSLGLSPIHRRSFCTKFLQDTLF